MTPFWLGEVGALVLASVGAAMGAWLGAWLGEGQAWAAALGAGTGLAAWLAWQARASAKVEAWLRSDPLQPIPRLGGRWGELAYRIERRLRACSAALEGEQQRHAHLLAAIEASPNGVLLLDSQDHIEWCSQRAGIHLGLDPSRDLGQRITNLVRNPNFVASLAREESFSPVVLARGTDGLTSTLICRYGEGSRLVLTQDVTERERTEAMRRDFVANVSHEIRTPLTVVAGFVETMRDLPLGPAERGRVLGLMHTQTRRMEALVADLLVLAKLEGSDLPQNEAWWPLDAWLEESLSMAQSLSAGRHRFEIEAPQPADIAGSRHELLSALSNLLSNAVRYTPHDGVITLRVRSLANDGLVVEVQDSGLGIAREHLPRLTERFYRVDQSRSRDTGGTGLGLAIVKHVMQRHGGELAVQSEIGQGSTFGLMLPASRVRLAPSMAAA